MNPEYPFQPQQPQQAPQPTPQVPGQYAVPGTIPQPTPPPAQPGYAPIPLANMPQMVKKPRNPAKKWVIMTFVFIFTTLAVGGVAGWAYYNYQDQKNNVDSKIDVAVAAGVKTQADKDAADFEQKEKQPNRQFVGPDDYGRLSFDYPKTWSVYVDNDASKGGTFAAYLNPVAVPPTSDVSQRFALRVTIEQQDYDKVVDSYKQLVSKGSLVSSSITADGQNGTRLDGNFTKDIRGSAVIFKIRDKTVTIRTDAADTFKDDFNALIKSITFNK